MVLILSQNTHSTTHVLDLKKSHFGPSKGEPIGHENLMNWKHLYVANFIIQNFRHVPKREKKEACILGAPLKTFPKKRVFLSQSDRPPVSTKTLNITQKHQVRNNQSNLYIHIIFTDIFHMDLFQPRVCNRKLNYNPKQIL